MAEKTIPWWRRALNYALGGIRSGFGLFSRPVLSVPSGPSGPVQEYSFSDRREETLEVETALIEQPTPPETMPAAEPAPAAAAAAELHSIDAADAIDLIEPAAGTAPLNESPADTAMETELEAEPEQETEIAPPPAEPAPEPETQQEPGIATPLPEPETETAQEPETETEPVAETISAAELEPAVEPLATDEPDPISEPRGELDPEPVELPSDLIEAIPEEATEPALVAEPAPVEAAEKLGDSGEIGGKHPSGAKAHVDSVGHMRGLKPPPPSESSFSAGCDAESIPEPVELPSDLIEAVPEEPAEPALVSEPAPVGESIPELPADQPVPPEPAAAEPVPMPEPTAATESISELVDSPSGLNESIPDPPADQPALPEQSAAAEPAPMPDSTAATEPIPEPQAARAAEPSAVAVSEPSPAVETSPPPAPAPKLPIKLETRDNEADLSPFSVVVDQVYDGPLDLLLDLIRKQDIDIYDIPIAKITAQFLAYVNQLKAGDVDVAGEFIYIASLLIHIKSKMLLPRAPSGPDDAAEDPRRELVERLLEHERFKNAAQMLQQKQMLEAATWTNPGFREFADDEAAEPEIAADTVDLVRIFRDILERARSRPVINVTDDSVTVGQMIQFLGRRLAMEDKPVALRRLLSHTQSERALIAMFLALLELVRMQAVLLRQDRAFSEIFIKKHTGFDAAMNEGLANARDDWQ